MLDYRGRRGVPVAERFWDKVAITDSDECWEWTGYTEKSGYARTKFEGKQRPVGQVAFVLAGLGTLEDPVPKPMCNRSLCVNPSHLETSSKEEWREYPTYRTKYPTYVPVGPSPWTLEELRPLRKQGTCRDAENPELWLTNYQEMLSPRERLGAETRADLENQRKSAITICSSCPVNDLCGAQAFDEGYESGIWGGIDFSVTPRLPAGHLGLRLIRSAVTRPTRLLRESGDRKPLRDYTLRELRQMSVAGWVAFHEIRLPYQQSKPCPAPGKHLFKQNGRKKFCPSCYGATHRRNIEWLRENYGSWPFPLTRIQKRDYPKIAARRDSKKKRST